MKLANYEVHNSMTVEELEKTVHKDFYLFTKGSSNYMRETDKAFYIFNLICAWSKNSRMYELRGSGKDYWLQYFANGIEYCGETSYEHTDDFAITVNKKTKFYLDDCYIDGFEKAIILLEPKRLDEKLNSLVMRVIKALCTYDHETAKKVVKDGKN